MAALALAFTMALDKGWLTIALALMVPGIAWIAEKRPLPALRALAALVTALVLARIAHEPRIVGADVGTTPIFNWLLYGYGIPAAAFWLGGQRLRRRADDAPARIVDLAAILFTVLLCFLEIRHFMTGGDVYREDAGLAELALHVWVWLALAIGLERLRLRTRSVVHDLGALAVGGTGARRHRVRTGIPRQSALDRRAGRRAVPQPHPARLRDPGAALRRARFGDARGAAAPLCGDGRHHLGRARARLSHACR